MYNTLLDLKGKKILEKYELVDIDLSNILIYRWSYDYLFSVKKLDNTISLIFKNIFWIHYIYKISIEEKLKIIQTSNNQENKYIINYLNNLFYEYEKNIPKEKLEKIFSLNNNYSRLKTIYYFFLDIIDYNSFLVLSNNGKTLFKNKESFIWNIDKENFIYNSDRSKIFKNDNILEKRFFWANSIFWTSNEQIFVNSIFLSKFGYIQKIVINQDNSISYFYKYKENLQEIFSLKKQIEALIHLNKTTFLWYHNWLIISYIQEDPNKNNFIWNEIIDFDVVNISYSFLQPIFLILDIVMWKDFTNTEVLKIFKYSILFFIKNEYYAPDFRLLWWEKIFDYYNKIFKKWLDKNNDWLLYNEDKLKFKKELLEKNKENILIFLVNEIK